MPVNLSIKNVPDNLAQRLRKRARRHHRSLQGELLAIMEEALAMKKLTVEEAFQQILSLDFNTNDEAVAMVRQDRDDR